MCGKVKLFSVGNISVKIDVPTGNNFRFLMYKTGIARMARQGMEGKICRAPKARGV